MMVALLNQGRFSKTGRGGCGGAVVIDGVHDAIVHGAKEIG